MRTQKKLTRLQEDVLFVVEQNGPVTPRDVAYHLPIGEASARGVLARLEHRGLVEATYTGRREGGRAYVVNWRNNPGNYRGRTSPLTAESPQKSGKGSRGAAAGGRR
jgi:predicted ArsR family transcriptional regulator